jgi:homogentisate 1,2-dioxygenase
MATRTTRRQGGKAPRAEQSAAVSYQSGFGNEFATEALTGALPAAQNSPHRAAPTAARGCTESGRPRCINRFASSRTHAS